MASPQQARLGTAQSEGNLSVNSRLSESRRNRLMDLRRREEMKDALVDRFKSRFGHGGAHRHPDEVSVASEAIRGEVQHFAGMENVTSNNLARLERRIQNRARGSAESEVSVYTAASGASRMSRSRSATSVAGAQMMGSGVPGAGGGGKAYNWSKLDEYASYLHEQDCMRQHMGVKALQKKLRLDLDQQVEQKQSRRVQESEENDRFHQNSLLELERWKQMEQLREQEKKDKINREQEDRDAQLVYERKLRSDEENKRKDEEASLVNKIVSEMELEQKKFEKKKDNTKKSMRKVFEENAKDQARKADDDRQSKERESNALKEYARILDEQEQARQAEMNERMERQNALMSKLQANVDSVKQGAGDNDAARANAQQDEMDQHFFEAEQCKQGRLKQLRLENQAYLLKQMEEKDGRKANDKELSDIQAFILEKDTEEYNEMEKNKVVNRRKSLVEHSKDIKKQMAYKLAQSQPLMTDVEIQLNKPLLQLVERTLNTNKERDQQSLATVQEEEGE